MAIMAYAVLGRGMLSAQVPRIEELARISHTGWRS